MFYVPTAYTYTGITEGITERLSRAYQVSDSLRYTVQKLFLVTPTRSQTEKRINKQLTTCPTPNKWIIYLYTVWIKPKSTSLSYNNRIINI